LTKIIFLPKSVFVCWKLRETVLLIPQCVFFSSIFSLQPNQKKVLIDSLKLQIEYLIDHSFKNFLTSIFPLTDGAKLLRKIILLQGGQKTLRNWLCSLSWIFLKDSTQLTHSYLLKICFFSKLGNIYRCENTCSKK
jgi:hypothetical protein